MPTALDHTESDQPLHAENTAKQQRGRPFKPGESGNPNGRPKGSRNQATLAIAALLDGESEALTRKLIETALTGDVRALRFCVERIAPTRRDQTVEFNLPPLETAQDVVPASAAVVQACAAGNLSPSEAAQVLALIATHARMLGLADIEARLRALESFV
ncbi:MAG: DUF5681 domain-containing protein [Xanthobacteraceae bacterium]